MIDFVLSVEFQVLVTSLSADCSLVLMISSQPEVVAFVLMFLHWLNRVFGIVLLTVVALLFGSYQVFLDVLVETQQL